MMRMKTRLLRRATPWLTTTDAAIADWRARFRRTLVAARTTVAAARETVVGAGQAVRERWPMWCQAAQSHFRHLRAGFSIGEVRRRARALRLWAVEHDTVPAETVAHARERWLDRQHRHEVHEIERQHRREEHAKFLEKKQEEERQTYSVYFE